MTIIVWKFNFPRGTSRDDSNNSDLIAGRQKMCDKGNLSIDVYLLSI